MPVRDWDMADSRPSPMKASPHYLLFSEASCSAPAGKSWRFVLQDVETNKRLVASDCEPAARGERLELLAVVRGLEALDGPARVTLVTRSRYVSRGMKHGLAEWRASEWQWERFGRVVPVKDCDLWQRVDRALLFHEVDCQPWQFEVPAESIASEAKPVAEIAPRRHKVSSRRRRQSAATIAAVKPNRLEKERVAAALPCSQKWSETLLGQARHWKDALKAWGTPSQPAVIQGAA